MPSPRFPVPQGSLDPALAGPRRNGCPRAEWKPCATGGDAGFYSLTPTGCHARAIGKASAVRLFEPLNLTLEEGSR